MLYTVDTPTFGRLSIKTWQIAFPDRDGNDVTRWRAKASRVGVETGGTTEDEAFANLVDILQTKAKAQ